MKNEVTGLVLDAYDRSRSRLLQLLSEQGVHWLLLPVKSWQSRALGEPLQRVQLQLSRRGELERVEEGVVLERYEGLRRDYPTLCSAQQIRQTLKKVAQVGLPCGALFHTAHAHLKALATGLCAQRVLSSFFVKLLLAEGYLDLESLPCCVQCGKSGHDLWNLQNQWWCQLHVPSSTALPWSQSHQQQLFELARNRQLSFLSQEGDLKLLELLRSWIKQL